MGWNIFKKLTGKKDPTPNLKPDVKTDNADSTLQSPDSKVESAQKPSAKPAPKKPQDVEAQIQQELDNLPREMMAKIKADPAAKKRLVDMARKMIKDGVDLKSDKQVKKWLKAHPQEASGQPEGPAVETYRREQPKVGRNDACLCGSGKKFKKCCGR
jgi:SEC-C motif